ncbi:AfsR/SARP family transcriptional regulator [Actinophytocola algeriensis]|uniref:DNA-binding SARP family transcriptional activator/tetratricopeptide (TPR) repeat protein n=1 Tax=Actinophytocola algeriensis TaxID=1768010 RepID=A0A7W7QDN5_9PSEU|nr:BTAD domain-containing putative transcriptional regulator [Actinophytocola algeriensis]MBB4911528.1 DNA-binding SARP family transcriptional activator/tetratricopeptide (TPR) repeat protein [Actinophytocola algeriensis]MBE1473484.1 DNA-binding SARP family transcriptional activator/tetratricopeptide (TPR) repeat protein [Actinophytocola algeriensis]
MLRLLGEVDAEVDGKPVDLGAPRQRCVLAALAVDAGQTMSVERLVERVWGTETAPRARATLHSYVSRLRRALAGVGGVAIVRRSGGYVLVVDATEAVVDLHRFRELCARARRDDAAASRSLTDALALWRGEALTGVAGEWVRTERDRLGQERRAAEHDLVDARLRAGDGGEVVAELSARATRNPLDERVACQYLLALHRAGRTGDALEHYQRVRLRLVEELGADPGAALQELYQQILAADPHLIAAPASATHKTPASEPVVPRQLPAAPSSFVGRRDELRRLDSLLEGTGTVAVAAIAGTGGVGKTSLALQWAHRHAGRFPDGHLFVDLRGFTSAGEPMPAEEAVRGFLDALGVEDARVPVDPHARSALFRTLVAGRRMLLVLDNAVGTDQVVPLLPGTGQCAVVVTSRNRLPGLITRQAAHHLPLDVLDDTEARALLADRLGTARVDAEQTAVDHLIAWCGGIPLALTIVTTQAHTRPHLSLTALAGELRDEATRIDLLDSEDPSASLPTVLSWSLRTLTAQQRDAFALLSIAPGPDIGAAAAANLLGTSQTSTTRILRALEEASLLRGHGVGRWRMHDLVRAYAMTLDLDDEVGKGALRRVLDFYTHTAHTGEQLLAPHRAPHRLDSPVPVVRLPPPADATRALAWFDTERVNLIAAQHTAVIHHWHSAVGNLAWSLHTYLGRRGHIHDAITVWQAAADALAQLPDPATVTRAHRNLGYAHAELGRHENAIDHMHQALALAEYHRDRIQEAHIHHALGWVWGRQRDNRQAFDHARRALNLYRDLDQPVPEAEALNAMGWYAARLGQHDTARDHCQAALVLHRHHRNLNGEANTLDSLGYIDHHNGHHDQALDHYRHALALHRALGNTYQVAHTLDRLGRALAALCHHEQARTAWLEALALYREQRREPGTARIQRHLDNLAKHHRADDPAARCHRNRQSRSSHADRKLSR